MTSPFVPRALLAAVTPPLDYDSVAGDLYEEYTWRVGSAGRSCANRWYWSQAFRSVPFAARLFAFLRLARTACGYSVDRYQRSFCLAMARGHDQRRGARGVPSLHGWPWFVLDWMEPAFFGAILAAIARTHGVRLALIASILLLGGFALPVAVGLSAPLPSIDLVLLLGAIPAMSAGAAGYQATRRR